MKTIDARGLSCPQPAFMTREAIADAGEETVEVLVDCETSRDNVSRCARNMGWWASVEDLPDGGFKLVLKRAI